MINETTHFVKCPNCKQLSIPASNQVGLLSDWCDLCEHSIFDEHYRDYTPIDPDYAAQQMEDNREL